MQLVHDISVLCARGAQNVCTKQDAPPGHNAVLVPVPHLGPHGLQAPFPMSWPSYFERSSSIVSCIVRYGAYAQVANPRGFTRRSRDWSCDLAPTAHSNQVYSQDGGSAVSVSIC